MPKGTVAFDAARCKGCELCVRACPKDLVEMDLAATNAAGYHPAMLNDAGGNCTGCALCAVACPDAVVTVYRYIVAKAGPVAVAA